ncbi:RAI1 like PD-XK nuclease-domain-containing protein [Crepidotus variabilis]|uniref:Decapping nuclease n=1 Tax=Crepidotus variabilis TaxID=179855 RepID=A0A9P6JVY1_9AGAR|nr:RAI1 like PD-XK nuclease-domain-containing protein [Crepidotus variabilis]
MASPSNKRKRSISELLTDDATVPGSENEKHGTSPPRTRRKIDENDASGQNVIVPEVESPSNDQGKVQNHETKAPTQLAFLAYPDLTRSKPSSVLFQQPSQLTTFSYTPEHVQEFTNSAMRYFVDPPSGANLSYGFERWIRKPDTRGRLDALLKAISKVKRNVEEQNGKLPEIGVVSWRGVMTKILTSPYENRDGWELNVMSINGTLYFEEHLTDARLQEKNNMEPRQKTQTYYGYAFESYCTSDSPHSSRHATERESHHGWGGDVDTNVQWCSVVRTKLGDTRLIIGGEVDCVRGKYTGQTDAFVELKTSLAIKGRHDEIKFEKKLCKFYFQSFLLGVPEIVVGFRTPAGVLTTVQSFKTIQIPRMVRGKPGAWDPLVCLEFGHRVLSLLKDITRKHSVQAENRQSVPVWRVKFVPGSGLRVNELEAAEVADVVNQEDRVGFLPRWYWNEIQDEGSLNSPEGAHKSAPAQPALTALGGWQL